MPTVIVRHKVGDFETWIKGHEDRVNAFAPAVSGFRTFHDTEFPEAVLLVLEVNDMDKLREILNTPETKKLKEKHTVIDPVILSIPVEV